MKRFGFSLFCCLILLFFPALISAEDTLVKFKDDDRFELTLKVPTNSLTKMNGAKINTITESSDKNHDLKRNDTLSLHFRIDDYDEAGPRWRDQWGYDVRIKLCKGKGDTNTKERIIWEKELIHGYNGVFNEYGLYISELTGNLAYMYVHVIVDKYNIWDPWDEKNWRVFKAIIKMDIDAPQFTSFDCTPDINLDDPLPSAENKWYQHNDIYYCGEKVNMSVAVHDNFIFADDYPRYDLGDGTFHPFDAQADNLSLLLENEETLYSLRFEAKDAAENFSVRELTLNDTKRANFYIDLSAPPSPPTPRLHYLREEDAIRSLRLSWESVEDLPEAEHTASGLGRFAYTLERLLPGAEETVLEENFSPSQSLELVKRFSRDPEHPLFFAPGEKYRFRLSAVDNVNNASEPAELYFSTPPQTPLIENVSFSPPHTGETGLPVYPLTVTLGAGAELCDYIRELKLYACNSDGEKIFLNEHCYEAALIAGDLAGPRAFWEVTGTGTAARLHFHTTLNAPAADKAHYAHKQFGFSYTITQLYPALDKEGTENKLVSLPVDYGQILTVPNLSDYEIILHVPRVGDSAYSTTMPLHGNPVSLGTIGPVSFDLNAEVRGGEWYDAEDDRVTMQLFSINRNPLLPALVPSTCGAHKLSPLFDQEIRGYLELTEYAREDGEPYLASTAADATPLRLSIDRTKPVGEFQLVNDDHKPLSEQVPTPVDSVLLELNRDLFSQDVGIPEFWNVTETESLNLVDPRYLTSTELDASYQAAQATAVPLPVSGKTWTRHDTCPAEEGSEYRVVGMRVTDAAGNPCYSYEVTRMDTVSPPPASGLKGIIIKDEESGEWQAHLDWQPSAEKGVSYIIASSDGTQGEWQESAPIASTQWQQSVSQLGYNRKLNFLVYAQDAAGNRSVSFPPRDTPCSLYTPVLMGTLSDSGIRQGWTFDPSKKEYDRSLSWLLEGGIVSDYQVKLTPPAKAGAGVEILKDEEGGFFTVGGLATRGSYEITIYGLDGTGRISGETRLNHTLENYTPGKAIPLSPLGQSKADAFDFIWQAAPDADELDLHYTLVIRDITTGAEHILPAGTNTTSYHFDASTSGFSFLHGRSYSWEILVEDTPLPGGEPLTSRSDTVEFKGDTGLPGIIFSYAADTLYLNEDLRVYIHPSLSKITAENAQYLTSYGKEGNICGLEYLEEGEYTGYYTGTVPLEHRETPYKITLSVKTSAGNTADAMTCDLLVDKRPPEITAMKLLEGDDGSTFWSGDETLSLELTTTDTLSGVKTLEYFLLETTAGEVEEENPGTLLLNGNPGEPGPATYTAHLPGLLKEARGGYVAIRLRDHAGNPGAFMISNRPVYGDASPPVLEANMRGVRTYAGSHYTRDIRSLSFTFTAEDPESSIAKVLYAAHRVDAPEQPVWREDWQSLLDSLNPADGETLTFRLKAINNSGLDTTFTADVRSDTTPPEEPHLTWLSEGPFAPGEEILLELSATDTESEITDYRLAIGLERADTTLSSRIGGNEDGWLSQPSKRFSLPAPEEPGEYAVTIAAENAAGLTTMAETTYPLHLESHPEKLSVTAGPQARSESTTLPLAWEYTGTRVPENFEYRLLGPGYEESTWEAGTPAGPENTPLVNLNLQHGGIYRVEVRAFYKDNGEEIRGVSHEILVDTTPPQFASGNGFMVPGACHAGNLRISWNIIEDETELHQLRLKLGTRDAEGESGQLGDDWLPLPPLKQGSRVIRTDNLGHPLELEDGEYLYLQLEASNRTGALTAVSAAPVLFDNSPPPCPLIIDQGDAIKLTQVEQDGLEWTWRWSESDRESGPETYRWQLCIGAREENFSLEETLRHLDPAGWQETGNIPELKFRGDNLPAHNQVARLVVKATNRAGLSSLSCSDGIIADNTGPWITSVRLQHSAEKDSPEAFYINSTAGLWLNISASDPESDVDRYLGTHSPLRGGDLETDSPVYTAENSPFPLGTDAETWPVLTPGQLTFFRGSCFNSLEQSALEDGYTGGVILDPTPPVVDEVHAEYRDDSFLIRWKASSHYAPLRTCLLEFRKLEQVDGQWVHGDKILTRELAGEVTSIQIPGNSAGESPLPPGEKPITDGYYQVIIKVINAAGTPSAAGLSLPILCDTTPPDLNLTLESDDPDNRHTHDKVTIAFTASDNAGHEQLAMYEYKFILPLAARSYTGDWQRLQTTAINPRLDINLRDIVPDFNDLDDGSILQVEARCRDRSNNIREGITASIILDITPPQVESFQVENNYISSRGSVYGTQFQLADHGSGLSSLQATVVFSADPAYLATLADTPGIWQPAIPLAGVSQYRDTGFQCPAPRTLIQGETCYLALLVTDCAGLRSLALSPALTIDYEKPTITFSEGENGCLKGEEFVFNTSPLSFYYKVHDMPGTEVNVKLSLENAQNVELAANLASPVIQETGSGHYIEYPIDAADYQSYTLKARLEDKAGNVHTEERTLRVNRPPTFTFATIFETTPGQELELSALVGLDDSGDHFTYNWTLPDYPGTNDISPGQLTSAKPRLKLYHTRQDTHRTEYTVTLRITDDDGKISGLQTTTITVLNTTCGRLYYNETWVGAEGGLHTISGPIIIPADVTLTIPSFTNVVVKDSGPEAPYRITVEDGGHLIIKKDAELGPVGTVSPPWWGGIHPLPGSKVEIGAARVRQAATGITLLPGASVTLEETTFTGNRVAIQVLNTDTLISNCHIADSYYYGIKEETEGTPQLSGNTFTGNNIAYYDKNETSLTQGELNNRNGNSGNTITE